MTDLELLAPARNLEIGIAAIDCGADAVYIAGPEFGARQNAGNSVADIAGLCSYAHRFGARIFVTVNTILFEEELERARTMIREVIDAGADALIVQDPAVLSLALPEGASSFPVPLHASTQCAIRTPEKAAFLSGAGFSRLVLERQLSLDEIRSIRAATDAELEFFVHGALCVSYSGECYMSECVAGRSANRGECIQACRSLYDLEDSSGKTLVKNKALLSLKDLNLMDRLEDLAEAGVCSFKIEGRLKGISYVRNTVRSYSESLDALVRKYPDRFRRSSFGRVYGGFIPDPAKSFNRGFTSLFIDGIRPEKLSSMEAPKHIGEKVGVLASVRKSATGLEARLSPTAPNASVPELHNGDGFSFVGPKGEIFGFRGDVCSGTNIRSHISGEEAGSVIRHLKAGTVLYRNTDIAFEKTVEKDLPVRLIPVNVDLIFEEEDVRALADTQDGREVELKFHCGRSVAYDKGRIQNMLDSQISKRTGIYDFKLRYTASSTLPMMSVSFINGIRRSIAEALDALPCNTLPMKGQVGSDTPGLIGNPPMAPERVPYTGNVSNSLSDKFFRGRGAKEIEPAYELDHGNGSRVLMRTRYCIRAELGLCPQGKGAARPAIPGGPQAKVPDALFLVNNGRRYRLGFDCRRCEMTVSEG